MHIPVQSTLVPDEYEHCETVKHRYRCTSAFRDVGGDPGNTILTRMTSVLMLVRASRNVGTIKTMVDAHGEQRPTLAGWCTKHQVLGSGKACGNEVLVRRSHRSPD